MKPTRHGALRGAVQLATEATAGLASLVEAVHARVARLPVGPAPERTSGITGLVYQSIRGVTHLVGGSADALLALLDSELQQGAPPTERVALLAALNGVFGDHLAASGNPLATPMSFRRDGQALPETAETLAAAWPDPGPALLLTLHGLCMHDGQWLRDGHEHGAALAQEFGFAHLALRYNSGRAVHENGRELAQRLQALADAWPQPLQRIVLLGHSMGGLLARSAVHQARQSGLPWPEHLSDLICLGTPHHGAPLEKAGHGIDLLLDHTPYAAPLARLGRLRSAGITDLREGRVLADAAPAPLPAGVRCRAVAGAFGGGEGLLDRHALGDGLVTVDSALGRHHDAKRRLGFDAASACVVPGAGHLALLSEERVHARLREWLAPPP